MFEILFKDYVNHFTKTSKADWSYEAGLVLLGAKKMYEAIGATEYFDRIVEYINFYVSEDGSLEHAEKACQDLYKIGLGKILCFLYEQEKGEKYKKVLDELVNRIRGMEDKYEALPLYLEYETKFNEKENYNDVYRCMKDARAVFQNEKVPMKNRMYDLMALIDMYENSSEEVFEQHKQYAIWFKAALRDALAYQQYEFNETAVIAYCMLKGCRLGILLQEKYQKLAEEMVCKLLELDFAEMKATGAVGIMAMAYAEYLMRSEIL